MRFSGFTDEWVSYKIGDISKTYSGGTPSTSKREYYEGNIPFIKSGKIGNEVTEQYINEEAINNSSAKKVQKGDLLLALYGATSGEVAISKIDGAINQAVLKIDNKMNNYFQYNYFVKYKDQIIHKYLQGGQGNLSANIIKKLEFYYPNLEEQQKISNYLLLIDNKIELLEKKHHEYQNFKKYLMQQIFAQKLRFNFDDEWKQYKLKDVLTVKSSSISINQLEENTGDYPLYGASGFLKNIDFCEMDVDYISIVKDGSGVGNLSFHEKNSSIVNTSQYLLPKKNFNINFLYYLLQTINLMKYVNGSSIPHIYFKDYCIEKINIPSLDEQEKIGKLFVDVDITMKNLNKNINATQEFKKGLLQQMFVVRINWRCNFKLAKSPSFNKHLLILKNKIIFIIIK